MLLINTTSNAGTDLIKDFFDELLHELAAEPLCRHSLWALLPRLDWRHLALSTLWGGLEATHRPLYCSCSPSIALLYSTWRDCCCMQGCTVWIAAEIQQFPS